MKVSPQVILLRDGSELSQGSGQMLANIRASLEIVDTLKTTLGPRGRDKLLIDAKGAATVSNDGATLLRKIHIVHPCAKLLVELSMAQDAEVGDGTTGVVVLAGAMLRELQKLLLQGAAPNMLIAGLRQTEKHIEERICSLQKTTAERVQNKNTDILLRCAETAMNSKLVYSHKEHFASIAVEVAQMPAPPSARMLGIKHIPGGALQESFLVRGIAFKKTFAYAGFEQQPKSLESPHILCLRTELELKAEYDNAEVRIETVAEYQNIVDAEWELILGRLQRIADIGATVVLSSLPIGDLATQFFSDRNIFCAGRVPEEDLGRVVRATGATMQSTLNSLDRCHLGKAGLFEERQLGNERYNIITACPHETTATVILRGGSKQFIDEVERSLHDAIMIARKAKEDLCVVPGAGATEMAISMHLEQTAPSISGKTQAVFYAAARAFEAIPRQLAENAALDSVLALALLRKQHADGNSTYGIDINSQAPADALDRDIIEPKDAKITAAISAIETVAAILSIDYTIKAQSNRPEEMGALPGMNA